MSTPRHLHLNRSGVKEHVPQFGIVFDHERRICKLEKDLIRLTQALVSYVLIDRGYLRILCGLQLAIQSGDHFLECGKGILAAGEHLSRRFSIHWTGTTLSGPRSLCCICSRYIFSQKESLRLLPLPSSSNHLPGEVYDVMILSIHTVGRASLFILKGPCYFSNGFVQTRNGQSLHMLKPG